MPTYEYRCRDCQEQLEVVQSIHDPALTQCPSCGGQLRKLFGNVGVVFKGSGFYRTDNRAKSKAGSSSEPRKAEAAKPDSGKSESGKSESGKTESGKSGSSAAEASKSEKSASPSSGAAPTKSGSAGSAGSSGPRPSAGAA